MTETGTDARTEYLARIQRLAEFLAASPAIPLPQSINGCAVDFWFTSGEDPKAALAACARAFGLDGWKKRTWDSTTRSYFEMSREWDGWRINLNAHRDTVCTKVLTGTERREVEEVVTPAVTVKVMADVETYEWRCEPVMAPADGEPAEAVTA
jgi:hypothetical protein